MAGPMGGKPISDADDASVAAAIPSRSLRLGKNFGEFCLRIKFKKVLYFQCVSGLKFALFECLCLILLDLAVSTRCGALATPYVVSQVSLIL